jgi:succinate dehydrogenase / fumarate reductase cytochrome b subunit
MSSTAPSKRDRPTNSLPTGKGLLDWVTPVVASTVGGKFLVAITGFILTGFVITHMAGNLQIFLGPDAINEYAKKLKDLGPLLWVARIGLLVAFVVHIALAARLSLLATAARPIGYTHPQTVQATFASRTMMYSGLMILAFTLFHIAHYTLGAFQMVQDTDGVTKSILELKDSHVPPRHDVYRMMIYGFSNPILAILYIVAQLFLMLHLSHGVASIFQTLGLNTPRLQSTWKCLGWAVTFIVGIGNIAMVVAVWLGMLPK